MPENTSDEARQAAFVKLTDAMAEYLEAIGWRALVAGEVSIERGDRKFIHYLRIKFTGGPRKADT
jgi:hypothetical protein